MKETTKRSRKVKDLLYSTYRGNKATRYGSEMENSNTSLANKGMVIQISYSEEVCVAYFGAQQLASSKS